MSKITSEATKIKITDTPMPTGSIAEAHAAKACTRPVLQDSLPSQPKRQKRRCPHKYEKKIPLMYCAHV